MVLSGHSDEVYIDVSKSCSQSGAHIILSENFPVPNINGPVFTIAQIIKFVNVLRCQSRTNRTFHLCQINVTPSLDPHLNGLATTQNAHTMRQFSSNWYIQWDHHPLKIQINIHVISLDPLMRISKPIPLLMVTCHHKYWQLNHQ